jgi:hypothetical protein
MTRTPLLALVVIAAACGGAGDGTTTVAMPSTLTGVIVEIDGFGGDVEAFVLDAGGEEYEIRIAPDVDYGFDLSHLYVHQSDGLPVRCALETRDGALYALRIDDASERPSPGSPSALASGPVTVWWRARRGVAPGRSSVAAARTGRGS